MEQIGSIVCGSFLVSGHAVGRFSERCNSTDMEYEMRQSQYAGSFNRVACALALPCGSFAICVQDKNEFWVVKTFLTRKQASRIRFVKRWICEIDRKKPTMTKKKRCRWECDDDDIDRYLQ